MRIETNACAALRFTNLRRSLAGLSVAALLREVTSMRFETRAAFAIASTDLRRILLAGLAALALTSCGVDEGSQSSQPSTNTTSGSFFKECFVRSDGSQACYLVGTCGLQEPPTWNFVSRTCVPCGDFSSCWNSR
jgi:hypothetical protein